MLPDKQKQILIDYLNLKVLQEDWRSVEDVARDLRSLPMSSRVQVTDGPSIVPPKASTAAQPAAILPVSSEIPHRVDEVLSLLRMDNEALIDKMFPDYSQLTEGEARAD